MRTTLVPDVPGDRLQAAGEALAGLGRAVGSLRCAGSQRLVKLGISMTHFHVLTLLRHHDAMPMGRLAEILDASMSSATGIIDRMEERGLVERVRVPDDRRLVLVRPTEAGLGLVDEAELVKHDVLIAALGRMSPDQLATVVEATSALAASIEAEFSAHPEYSSLACDHVRHASAPADASPAPGAPLP